MRRFRVTAFLLAASGLASWGAAAEPGRVLAVPGAPAAVHLVVPLPEGLAPDAAPAWRLVEIDAAGATIPVELVAAAARDGTADPRRRDLVATIPPRGDTPARRRFRLEPAPATAEPARPVFRWKDVSATSLGLWEGDRPVLVYNHGPITGEKVPASDARRTRGCYFHPLYGLSGERLTDDFPADHYHHHGLFWAWPHVGVGGREYDLWIGNNIRLQFVRWLGRGDGEQCGLLGVENGWFVGDKKVVIERVWLRAHPATADAQALDLTMAWIPVDEPVTLRGAEGKSYGGLSLRYDIRPRQRTTITVPAGVSTADLPETRLPWADLAAQFAGLAEPSGAAVMIAPSHPGYPPMWLTRHYGILCVGTPGIESKTFTPQEPLLGSYRVWIHKRSADLARLKAAYEAYTAGCKAAWE